MNIEDDVKVEGGICNRACPDSVRYGNRVRVLFSPTSGITQGTEVRNIREVWFTAEKLGNIGFRPKGFVFFIVITCE